MLGFSRKYPARESVSIAREGEKRCSMLEASCHKLLMTFFANLIR